MPFLELRGISKRFDAVQALLGVDLTVEAREVLALVGDNGAGKSTLIKIISGVHPPDGGEIWLDGRRVHIDSPEVAKGLGIETVYQDLALFEHADVSANLFAGREMTRRFLGILPILDRGRMRNFARETLARLRIQIPGIDRSMKLLSGGQRQSVAIGRAIAFGTKLVIMDEPTAALGAVESAKALDLVRGLKARGVTVIVVSHNLQHVFSVADRIAVLRRGQMVGIVRPSETSGEVVVRMIVGADEAAVDLPAAPQAGR
jgi:simple sugar transport system ATP-binding protein